MKYSWMIGEPRLLVMMTMVFLKSTVRPLPVREPAVVEHLQQHVEHVAVRLLDLVEQDHGVRFAAHRFAKLPAFLVTDVARRRADESRNRVLLHIFAHVDPDHGLLVVE